MGIFRWVLGGLVGAAAGIAIWTIVGYFSHLEAKIIALGVGFLVGLGVRYAAYLGGEDASLGKGVFAAAVAVVAIFAAKFLVFSLVVASSSNTRKAADVMADVLLAQDNAAIAKIAHEIAVQAANGGETIAWPPGVSATSACKKGDYPQKIWADAEIRLFEAATPFEKERRRQRWAASLELSSLANEPDFRDSFSPWDLLWFGLAIVTAYKVGVGSYGQD